MLRGLIFDNSAGLKAVETAPGVFTIQATAGGTPGAHASTHKSGGSDPVKLDELAAPTDVTTLNATASAHGLLPKLDGSASKYLDGSGAWSTPAGGGGSSDGYYPTMRLDLRYPNGTGTTGQVSTLIQVNGAECIVYNENYSGDIDSIPALTTTNLMTRSPRLLMTAGTNNCLFFGPRLKSSPFTSLPIFYHPDKFIVRYTFAVDTFTAANTQMGAGLIEDGYQWNGPSTSVSNKSGITLQRDANDTNWYVCHNDSTGGVTRVDTGIPVTAAKVCRLEFKSDGTNITWKLEQEGSTTASGTLTTNLPTAMMCFGVWVRKNSGSTPKLALMDFIGIPFQSASRSA